MIEVEFAILVLVPQCNWNCLWLREMERMAGMRVIRRMLLIGSLLPASAGLAGQVQASVDQGTPARGGKTVKECNQELARNVDALEAAGESASAFFHACWLHGEKGKPTPIVADGQGAATQAGQPDGQTTPRRAADAGERRAIRHASRHAVARPYRERRTARARPERDDDEAAGIDDAAAFQSQAAQYQADRPPGHVNIGVPLVGVVAVPILPGLETTVQGVVEHPVVPGLVSTSP